MNDDIKIIKLGDFSPEHKERLSSDIELRKRINTFISQSRQDAKLDKCYYCGKSVESFCNSHSIPAFCLRNIAIDGEVATLNTLIDNPLFKKDKGVNNSGTFHLICRECDSTIFSEYENPDNYTNIPTGKMITQIALKNALKLISKRNVEIQFYNSMKASFGQNSSEFLQRNFVNELDLKEFERTFKLAKKALEKKDNNRFHLCYYEKLNYVVPVAFQDRVALIFDLHGNVINDIYNLSPKYKVCDIHICIFPLEKDSVVFMFIENGEKRYRSFYKQFRKLTLEDRLSVLNFIMFAYCEDVYYSKNIIEFTKNNQQLISVGKSGSDIKSNTLCFDRFEIAKNHFDFNIRFNIPNLLSEKYKIR